VGYIVAEQLHRKPVTLYYAFLEDPPAGSIRPYYFSGTTTGVESATDNQGRRTQKVTFRDVH
jgi:hypothetical protein